MFSFTYLYYIYYFYIVHPEISGCSLAMLKKTEAISNYYPTRLINARVLRCDAAWVLWLWKHIDHTGSAAASNLEILGAPVVPGLKPMSGTGMLQLLF